MPELTRERLISYATAKAMYAFLGDYLSGEKEVIDAAMVERYNETDDKQKVIKIPGAEKIATLTLAEPKPQLKVEADALLEWCRENRPELVETVTHAPVEGWTESRLTPDALKLLQKECTAAGDAFYTEDGQEVAGLTYVPAPAPKSASLLFVGNKDGQRRLLEAYRGGELGGIAPAPSLPAIGGRP